MPVPPAVGGVAGVKAQGSVLSAAPAEASGALAVRMAGEAARMREARSVESLAAADAQLTAELEEAGAGAGAARAVAGRIFRLDGGVWKDASHPADREPVRVKAFSEAYFRLLEALPELKPVLGGLGDALVSGARVSILVGDEGAETLTEAKMREIVAAFRGAPAAP
jgi:hypothetical protein